MVTLVTKAERLILQGFSPSPVYRFILVPTGDGFAMRWLFAASVSPLPCGASPDLIALEPKRAQHTCNPVELDLRPALGLHVEHQLEKALSQILITARTMRERSVPAYAAIRSNCSVSDG